MTKLKLYAGGIGALVVIVLALRYVHPGPLTVWLILLAGIALVVGLMWVAVVDPPPRTRGQGTGRSAELVLTAPEGHQIVATDFVTLTETRERITRSVTGPVDKLRQVMPGTAWVNRTQEIEIMNGEITNGE